MVHVELPLVTENPSMPYPERMLELPEGELEIEVGRPKGYRAVMGAGGKPEHEVYVDQLARLGIPLYKRKGGGGTVLLGPGTIVVTIHAGVLYPYKNKAYFHAINRAIIGVFRTWKKLDYQERGLSDIAVDDRKIVGSSMYRKRQYLLYQASILASAEIDLIEKLLKPPPRQPDYRRSRDHRSFITDLRGLGILTRIDDLIEDLRKLLPDLLIENLNRVGFRSPTC